SLKEGSAFRAFTSCPSLFSSEAGVAPPTPVGTIFLIKSPLPPRFAGVLLLSPSPLAPRIQETMRLERRDSPLCALPAPLQLPYGILALRQALGVSTIMDEEQRAWPFSSEQGFVGTFRSPLVAHSHF